jgi:hypothetical protein
MVGALPDDETERLDELSITDPSFADRLNAVEYDLVDSYVRGEALGRHAGAIQVALSLVAGHARQGEGCGNHLPRISSVSSGLGRRSFRTESLSRWALAAAPRRSPWSPRATLHWKPAGSARR